MKDGGPAFPYVHPLNKAYEDGSTLFPETPGMSLRDWLAGKALQGILSNAETM